MVCHLARSSRHRDRADARSRCRVTLHPPPLDRSPRAVWRSGSATMRTAGIGARTAAVDDAIGPVTVDFLRAQIEDKPLAHRLARVVLLASGLVCCNGTPLAGGCGFG